MMKKLSMKYFSDESKLRVDDNTLYDSAYVRVLADTFEVCEMPLTFALQGSWGTGKTTMMNMVKDLLDKNNIVDFYQFNAWQFSQFGFGEQLPLVMLSHLINDLNKEVKAEGFLQKAIQFIISIKNIVVNIVKTIGDVLIYKVIGYSNVIKDISNMSKVDEDAIERLGKLQGNFKNAIDAKLKYDKKQRMLIFVDDIDRLDPNKAVELLECIKIFCVCDKCIFVLAVDYDVVLEGAKKKFKEKGKDFFDKIIQVPFIMPIANHLDEYISKLLKQSYEDVKDESLKKDLRSRYALITKLVIGNNPRSIKRVLNSFIINDTVMFEKGLYDNTAIKENEAISHYIRLLLLFLVCVQSKNTRIYSNLVEISTKMIIEYKEVIRNMKDYIFEFESISGNEDFIKSLFADVNDDSIKIEPLIDLYIKILKDLSDIKDLNIIKGVFDISESTNVASENDISSDKAKLAKASKHNFGKWENVFDKLFNDLVKVYPITKNSKSAFYSIDIINDNPQMLGFSCKVLMVKLNFIYELPTYENVKLRVDVMMQYDDMPGFTSISREQLPESSKKDLDLIEHDMQQIFRDIDKNSVVEELVEGFSAVKYRNVMKFKISSDSFSEIKDYLCKFIDKLYKK